MAKLEDILKTQGYTDADIATQAAFLNDPKMRAALEASYGAIETRVAALDQENQNWAKWHETDGKPTLALYEKDMTDAKAEAASLKERLRLAEAAGFAPRREEAIVAPIAPTTPEAFDYKKHNLVTRADVNELAEMESRAIALVQDLTEEYRHLTGKSLIEYSAQVDGRTLKGMSALREEAKLAKQPLDIFVSTKFGFAEKRQANDDARRKAAEDAIRADERAKTMTQYGDPSNRTLMPSTNPFIPRPQGDKPVMPWERTAQERSTARIQNAMQTQSKSMVN